MKKKIFGMALFITMDLAAAKKLQLEQKRSDYLDTNLVSCCEYNSYHNSSGVYRT